MREVPVPEVGPGEVLCKIKAIAICGSDPEIINGHHSKKGWPPRFPFTLGHEWSGVVAALGAGVNEFKVGRPSRRRSPQGAAVPARTA